MQNAASRMVDHSYVVLGARVRERRDALGMTQETLAAQVGLSRASIANIERGRQALLVHQLLRIATALNAPPLDLLPSQTGSATMLAETEPMPEEMSQLLRRLDMADTRR